MAAEFRKRACQNKQRLSKRTLLAMLPSNIDSDIVVEVSTGNEIRIGQTPQRDVQRNINYGIWKPLERSQPRKMLLDLDEDHWQILSFDPLKREVCIQISVSEGMTHTTSVILPVLSVSGISSN